MHACCAPGSVLCCSPTAVWLLEGISKQSSEVMPLGRALRVADNLQCHALPHPQALEDVYEDDTHVHMVLEYCKGGELHHRIGETVYSGGCPQHRFGLVVPMWWACKLVQAF